MYNLISFSHFAQVTLFRMIFAVVGVFVSAHSAQCEESSPAPAPNLDILTIQPVFLESNWHIFYRLNTNTTFAPLGKCRARQFRIQLHPKIEYFRRAKRN